MALPGSDQEAVFEGTDILDGEGQLEKLVNAVCGMHDAGLGCDADGQVVEGEDINSARTSRRP